MRRKKTARALLVAAGMLAVTTIASPAASASYMHNIVIDGESLPSGTQSISVWDSVDGARPDACIKYISGRPSNIDTGILFPSDEAYSFWAEASPTCGNRYVNKRIKCLCGVVLRDSDPMNYLVRISPPR